MKNKLLSNFYKSRIIPVQYFNTFYAFVNHPFKTVFEQMIIYIIFSSAVSGGDLPPPPRHRILILPPPLLVFNYFKPLVKNTFFIIFFKIIKEKLVDRIKKFREVESPPPLVHLERFSYDLNTSKNLKYSKFKISVLKLETYYFIMKKCCVA